MMLDMEHKIYLSRGKRLDNKQWVYGAVLFHDGNAATIFNQHFIWKNRVYQQNARCIKCYPGYRFPDKLIEFERKY